MSLKFKMFDQLTVRLKELREGSSRGLTAKPSTTTARIAQAQSVRTIVQTRWTEGMATGVTAGSIGTQGKESVDLLLAGSAKKCGVKTLTKEAANIDNQVMATDCKQPPG